MNNDQTLAEDATLKSEELHRIILRAAMDGFWLMDLQGQLLEVNDAYCRMSGYTEAELLTMCIADLTADESREQASAHISRIKEQGQERFETRHLGKDGSTIEIEISAQYQDFGGGRIIAFLRDITERRLAEKALIESDTFIRSVMDNLPIGIAVNSVDPAVSFLYMNDNFPGFYRTCREAITSQDAFWSAVYEDPGFRAEMRRRVLADCATSDPDKMHWIDVPITRNGEETKYIEARNTLIPDKQLMVSTVWDVTARKQAELALLQVQELYEDLVNTLPAGVYLLRVKKSGTWQKETWQIMAATQYSLEFASDRFCTILGITRETLAANPAVVSDFIHPDDKENFDARNAQAMTDFNTFIWEGRIVSNQQTRWVHFESVPRAIDPETVLWTGIVYEITELKQAVKEREQFFKFFQTSADLMCLAEPNGYFMKTNPSFSETLGYSEAELLAKPIVEFIHPDDRQATLDEIMEQRQRGFTDNFANRYICKDGSVKWLSWRVNYSKDDKIAYATARDITDNKKAGEALRESENRLRFALEGTNDGLWDVQMKTGTTYLSPRGCEILGYQLDEACEVATVWADLVHPDDLPLTNERLREHLEGRTPIFEVEQRLRMKSGDWKWVLARGKVVSRDEAGVPLRMTGTHTDLTEQRKLQEQLSQAQKMEAVGRLAGGVAHDFNNMLNVILGHAALALTKEANSPVLREHLEQIQKAAVRSADIVSQLLAFARKQTITPRVLDLNESVATMLKMLRRLIGEGIELVWLPAKELWPVRMDPSQIDQILTNLCVNARDAVSGAGRISIGTSNKIFDTAFCSGHKGFVPGEYVLLTMSDDGCGMNKETLSMIFEPFFTTKGVGEGTGLGLAMVYGIVKQNAGFIDVYSEPGQGTIFNIYLPRHLGKEEQLRLENPVEPADRGHETVLLVEDEPALLELGIQMLEMQGYRVLAAATPGEAVKLAEEHLGEIHLLLTDVVMPEMNGRELAKKLLALYPGLKRLFMSGYTADVIAHHGVIDEEVKFIQKPFSLDALAAKVREALDH